MIGMCSVAYMATDSESSSVDTFDMTEAAVYARVTLICVFPFWYGISHNINIKLYDTLKYELNRTYCYRVQQTNALSSNKHLLK